MALSYKLDDIQCMAAANSCSWRSETQAVCAATVSVPTHIQNALKHANKHRTALPNSVPLDAYLHGCRPHGGHDHGALRGRVRVCELEGLLCDLGHHRGRGTVAQDLLDHLRDRNKRWAGAFEDCRISQYTGTHLHSQSQLPFRSAGSPWPPA